MSGTFGDKVLGDFARDIAGKLNEAAIIVRTATGLGEQGLSQRAFAVLLDIEPLLTDATILLNATSVVRRRDRESGVHSD